MTISHVAIISGYLLGASITGFSFASVEKTTPKQPISASSQLSKKSEEYQIGIMVKAISAALKTPKDPKSLSTIIKYGHDSRYYVMIRGWLVQELQGVESQHRATRDPEAREKFSSQLSMLKKAIRRIDLE